MARPTPLSFRDGNIQKQAGPRGCWLWVGSTDKDGYGRSGGHYVHRTSYTIYVGEIPEGMTIDHLCRVRNCVNPDHLEPVPIRENIMRGDTAARFKSEQTSCVNGHPFDEKNTGMKYPPSHPNGMRFCRACKSNQDRANRTKRNAQRQAQRARKKQALLSSNGA